MDSVIDCLWRDIKQTCPIINDDWMECFAGDQSAREQSAKQEISDTLEQSERWRDRAGNFLLRLISDDEHGYGDQSLGLLKPRVQLALAFVQRMSKYSELDEFLVDTLNERKRDLDSIDADNQQNADDLGEKSEATESSKLVGDGVDPGVERGADIELRKLGGCENSGKRTNGILHEAAKSGRCGDLIQFLKQNNVDIDAPNNIGETALHLAAEFEHPGDVDMLLEAGAVFKVDDNNCTPLHSAAMAINPSPEIAELLVRAILRRNTDETMDSDVYRLLNQESEVSYGGNTALHIAAGNVNVTSDFIQQLKLANAKIENSVGDTAFHVAAKSSNSDAIVYMLKTFAPSKGGWDVDDVDRNRERKVPPLPSLISICACSGNAEAVALLIQQGADLDKGVLHEIVIESVKVPEKTDQLLAVYRAIVDNVVTWRCLEENTKLKTKGSQEYYEFMRETMVWLITQPMKHDDDYDNVIQRAIDYGASDILNEILNTKDVFRFKSSKKMTHYDVTNFTLATKHDRQPEKPRKCQSPSREPGRDYAEQFELAFDTPYLQEIVNNYDIWRDTNILEKQPIRELTKPYIRFVQKCYLILGIIQLVYMIYFSMFYIPTTCSLIEMFNLNASAHNCAPMADNGVWNYRAPARPTSWIWLVWPVLLLSGNAIRFVTDMYWIIVGSFTKMMKNCIATVNRPVVERWPMKVMMILGRIFPSVSFCTSVFFWYVRYTERTNHILYLKATAMVLLFGWITNFFHFSRMTQRFCVFALMLKDIIIKEIALRFLLIFFFTIIGFTFAIHVLRMSELPSDEVVHLSATLYDLFFAALGTGDYIQMAREERAQAGIQFDTFEFVVICYVCMTTIILLNVLIAVVGHRYDMAKEQTENVWRLQMLRIALDLERVPGLRQLFAAQLHFDLEERDFCCCCCIGVCCCQCRHQQVASDGDKHSRKFLKVYYK